MSWSVILSLIQLYQCWFLKRKFSTLIIFMYANTRVYTLDDGWVTSDGQAFTILIDGRVARNTSK